MTHVVGYQGEPGAYSEEAAISHFGEGRPLKPCRTITDVFEGVERGELGFGIIPVENSIGGNVYESYDHLISSSLSVVAEVYLPVSHCLVSNEGATAEGIRRVYSHPQALEQCREYLKSLGAEMLSAYDTAGSAKAVRDGRTLHTAAVASERAASIYGLAVLKRNIEDRPGNITRFLIIAKHARSPVGRSKSSIVFQVSDTPGSLYKALSPFAARGINLTKIESRPTREKPWEYYFLLDFEGSAQERMPAEAIEELRSSAPFVRIIGSYPAESRI